MSSKEKPIAGNRVQLPAMYSPAQVGTSRHVAEVLTTRDSTRPMANVPVSVPEIAPSAVVRATTYIACIC